MDKITLPYLNFAEAGGMLGLSRQRVGVLVREGRLPTVETAGGGRLIPLVAVKKFRPNPTGRPRTRRKA